MSNIPSAVTSVLLLSDQYEAGGAEVVFRVAEASAREIGLVSATYVAEGRRTPWSYLFSHRNRRRVSQLVKRMQPDIVHLHNFYHRLSPSVLFALRSARRAGWHGAVVFTAHDYHIICPNSGLQRVGPAGMVNLDPASPLARLRWRYDNRSRFHGMLKYLQHCLAYRVLHLDSVIDLILTPSEFTKRVLEQAGKGPVLLHRNPVSLDVLEAAGSEASRPEGPRLVYFGRLSAEKGLVEVMEAIDALLSEGAVPRGLKLDLFGSGPQESEIRVTAARLKHLKVSLMGELGHPELFHAVSGYSALIVPSRWYEVAPLSVLEGAALGLPLIVPDGGAYVEMAAFANRSYFYSHDDSASLARAIVGALARGNGNRVLNANLFSHKTFVRETARLYESALALRRPT